MKTNIINFMLVGANSQAWIDPTHSVHILCFIQALRLMMIHHLFVTLEEIKTLAYRNLFLVHHPSSLRQTWPNKDCSLGDVLVFAILSQEMKYVRL